MGNLAASPHLGESSARMLAERKGFRETPQRKAPSRSSLRALCVPSAFFALRHTRAPLFNAKAEKEPLNQIVFSDTEALRMLKFEGSEVCG